MILPAMGIISEIIPGLRAQADLRLQGGRALDRRDRLLLDAGLGAPHVHRRAAELPERLLHALVDDHRDPDRGEDLQLARHALAGQPEPRDAAPLRARLPLDLHRRRALGHLPCRLHGGLAGARHVLRGRPLPLRAVRRVGLRDHRRTLVLVAEDVRPDAPRSGWASGRSSSSSSGSTSRSSRSTCSA